MEGYEQATVSATPLMGKWPWAVHSRGGEGESKSCTMRKKQAAARQGPTIALPVASRDPLKVTAATEQSVRGLVAALRYLGESPESLESLPEQALRASETAVPRKCRPW